MQYINLIQDIILKLNFLEAKPTAVIMKPLTDL